jgi:hypothetical protein
MTVGRANNRRLRQRDPTYNRGGLERTGNDVALIAPEEGEPMRGPLCSTLSLLVASTIVGTTQHAPTSEALARLDEVRRAVGGDRSIAAIKSLSLGGTLRIRNQYFGRVPEARSEFQTVKFDIKILLPDHCLERQDYQIATHYTGFAGNTLLNRTVFPAGRVAPNSDSASMIGAHRANCGYMVLFLTLRTDTVFPFEFREAGPDTLTFRSPEGIDIAVDVDAATNLPFRFRYDTPAPSMKAGTAEKLISVLEVGDYRDVGGWHLPHRLTLSRKDRLEMDRQLDTLEVNPPLTADDFRK